MAVIEVAATRARGAAEGCTAEHAVAGGAADQSARTGAESGARQGMSLRIVHAVASGGCKAERRDESDGGEFHGANIPRSVVPISVRARLTPVVTCGGNDGPDWLFLPPSFLHAQRRRAAVRPPLELSRWERSATAPFRRAAKGRARHAPLRR